MKHQLNHWASHVDRPRFGVRSQNFPANKPPPPFSAAITARGVMGYHVLSRCQSRLCCNHSCQYKESGNTNTQPCCQDLQERKTPGIRSLTATHCHTLQHIATHCNMLQHAATHCNTLLHAATHRNTLQHAATRCNTLQHTATHCNMLEHIATHCNTLHHTTHYNTLQHTATYCNTLQHTAVTHGICNLMATHCNTLQHTATR